MQAALKTRRQVVEEIQRRVAEEPQMTQII